MISFSDHGQGPALICLHGVGGNRNQWRRQIDAVVAAGWRIIALDAPGIGETTRPAAPGFKPHVAAVMEAMETLGLETAAFCGHSLGGMTAQEVYAAHPDRVSALVLSATSPAFGKGAAQDKFLTDRLEPFKRGVTMAEFAEKSAPRLLGPDASPALLAELTADIAATPVAAYTLGWRSIAGFDRRAQLPDISVPCLLLAGEHDANSPAPMVEKMASKIPGAEYVLIPGVGHMMPMEAPEAFNAALTDFLKRIAR